MSVVLAVLITPAMLLSSTKVDARNITGMQGRYFTPFIPLVMILITKFKIHRKALAAADERVLNKIRRRLLTGVAAFLCIFVYLMVDRYLKR